MKKNIIVITWIILSISSGLLVNAVVELEAKKVNYSIVLNGKQQAFQNDIVTINDSTYVPLRELSDKLGLTVDWIGQKQLSFDNGVNETVFLYDEEFKEKMTDEFYPIIDLDKSLVSTVRNIRYYTSYDPDFHYPSTVVTMNLEVDKKYGRIVKGEELKIGESIYSEDFLLRKVPEISNFDLNQVELYRRLGSYLADHGDGSFSASQFTCLYIVSGADKGKDTINLLIPENLPSKHNQGQMKLPLALSFPPWKNCGGSPLPYFFYRSLRIY